MTEQLTLGIDDVALLPDAPASASPAPLPVMLMRRDADGKTWHGPGVWCHLSYATPRRVRGIDANGKHSDDVPAIVELCAGGAFDWFPTVAHARAEAHKRHHGERSKHGPSVRTTDGTGLFGWERSNAWALATAGYRVIAWDNGVCHFDPREPGMYGPDLEPHCWYSEAGWRNVVARSYADEYSVEDKLRAVGIDPEGPTP